jgi:hypothetical protein
MKSSLLLNLFAVATLGTLFSFSPPALGQDAGMLNQALDLVHQAWNPGGDPPSNAQRTDLLTKALKLAQDAPQRHVKGHRVKAIEEIQEALDEIQKGDPDHKVDGLLHDANSELRTAISDT